MIVLAALRVSYAFRRNGLVAALTDKGDVLLWDARTLAEGGLQPPAPSKEAEEADWQNVKRIDIASLSLPPASATATPAASASSWWWPFGGSGSKAGAETITQVECGSGHVAMVTSRGRVLVMGDNNYGQVRDSTLERWVAHIICTCKMQLSHIWTTSAARKTHQTKPEDQAWYGPRLW